LEAEMLSCHVKEPLIRLKKVPKFKDGVVGATASPQKKDTLSTVDQVGKNGWSFEGSAAGRNKKESPERKEEALATSNMCRVALVGAPSRVTQMPKL